MKEYFKDDFKSTGQIVKHIREEKGLTQHQLATNCSVERGKISLIENGHLDFRHSTLLEIAKGLDVHVSRLIPRPEDPQ